MLAGWCNNYFRNMALIVFLRGINVGGHRTFRPKVLAKELGAYDVVNVGAAGTPVVRKPGSRLKFFAELRRRLPFEAKVACCDSRDLIRLEMENPFGSEPSPPQVVRFVSILSKPGRGKVSFPIALPEDGEWFVRIIGSKDRLVFGVYRRHMKTIGYLGRIDELFGAPATTRGWKTILSVVRILKTCDLRYRPNDGQSGSWRRLGEERRTSQAFWLVWGKLKLALDTLAIYQVLGANQNLGTRLDFWGTECEQ
jgi:uncharacterized protein (DUF1697 family)